MLGLLLVGTQVLGQSLQNIWEGLPPSNVYVRSFLYLLFTLIKPYYTNRGFPGSSSDDKAYAYNAGDLGLIPGLGRSPGE